MASKKKSLKRLHKELSKANAKTIANIGVVKVEADELRDDAAMQRININRVYRPSRATDRAAAVDGAPPIFVAEVPIAVGMSVSIIRFRYQLLPRRIHVEAGHTSPKEWISIVSSGRYAGEEALISSCLSYEYVVRRALVAIRFGNKGFMGQCSLMQIVDNSVATAQFCRLTKIIHAECCFVTGLLHPSKIKVKENDSEGEVVLAQLRSMTAEQLTPDDGVGTSSDLCRVTDTLDFRRSLDDAKGWIHMNRFVDHVMMAMDRYKKSIRSQYTDQTFDEGQMPLYNKWPISMWGLSDSEKQVIDPHGITETTSQIQLIAGIKGTNEDLIKRICTRVTVFVLFVEACAIKTILNTWKASNLPKREIIVERVLAIWNTNTQYIASQQSLF